MMSGEWRKTLLHFSCVTLGGAVGFALGASHAKFYADKWYAAHPHEIVKIVVADPTCHGVECSGGGVWIGGEKDVPDPTKPFLDYSQQWGTRYYCNSGYHTIFIKNKRRPGVSVSDTVKCEADEKATPAGKDFP